MKEEHITTCPLLYSHFLLEWIGDKGLKLNYSYMVFHYTSFWSWWFGSLESTGNIHFDSISGICVLWEIDGCPTSFERGGGAPFLKMPSLEPTILDSFNSISNLLFREGCLESDRVAATEECDSFQLAFRSWQCTKMALVTPVGDLYIIHRYI